MHRIDTKTAQKDKFGAGKNGFIRYLIISCAHIPFRRFSQTNIYENAEITSKWHHSCFC